MSSENADASYDIIFAGGGTTACVIASRLAKAHESLRILILEAGPDSEAKLEPEAFSSQYISQPSQALADRSIIVEAGRCLGGGSSVQVNGLVYTRASASDYDDWERIHENPGWGCDKLIPLLKKTETYQGPGDRSIHGDSGPLKVSHFPDHNDRGIQFLEAAKAYDKGRPHTDDVNDFYNCNAYGKWFRYVDGKNGRPSDVPSYYIHNQSFTNLEILPFQRVVRVLFKDNIAVGVEHIKDSEGPSKESSVLATSYASRLVVVSAGTFGSPSILERSGIGAADILGKYQVTSLVDLPGVGENYMDHNLGLSTYLASETADALGAHGKEAELEPSALQSSETDKGLISHKGFDAGIKIRPDAEDLRTMPEFEERWKTYFANSPDKSVMFIGPVAGDFWNSEFSEKYYTLSCYTSYPASTGRVHITSGTDPHAALEFHSGLLDREEDLAVLRWSYKHARELARRMRSYCGELASTHPKFSYASDAACRESAKPLDAASPKINYTHEDDRTIDDHHRRTVLSTCHSCGTCSMKPLQKGGVVDPRLNVYGVRHLKVADCSIMPSNAGANLYNTALAIGERAAVIIAEDLGIDGVAEE